MADRLRFTILGCGSSPGVPRIGGEWGACNPDNPKNRRRRCSFLVERISSHGKTTVVIDTSPDFRAQMLDAKVQCLDGVLYTHSHADHVHGIDDLRGFVILQRERIKIYADDPTFERLYAGFQYCFEAPENSMYPPLLNRHTIEDFEEIIIDGEGGKIRVLPIPQIHGPIKSLGFRFVTGTENDVCYSSDISDIGVCSVPRMQYLGTWIVDALQYKPHISHFSLSQSLDWIEELAPKRAILTHMHVPMDYDTVKAETPDHVEPAYDGMQFEVSLGQGSD